MPEALGNPEAVRRPIGRGSLYMIPEYSVKRIRDRKRMPWRFRYIVDSFYNAKYNSSIRRKEKTNGIRKRSERVSKRFRNKEGE